jgi:SLT domain-containing protein
MNLVHGFLFFNCSRLCSGTIIKIKIHSFRSPRKTTQHINIYYYYIAGKVYHQMSPGKAAVEKTGQRVQKRCPLKACRRSYKLGPPLLSV